MWGKCKNFLIFLNPQGNYLNYSVLFSKTVMTQQDIYYAELRLDKLIQEYLNACHRFKGFQHSSVGLALAKKMNDLQKLTED